MIPHLTGSFGSWSWSYRQLIPNHSESVAFRRAAQKSSYTSNSNSNSKEKATNKKTAEAFQFPFKRVKLNSEMNFYNFS
jgi:hypothetical protein